jgi:acetyl coenzyme A synthetase (ADP forming)-like protein
VIVREPEPEAVADVILRDGSTLRLRAPASEDVGALRTFFATLSNRSLYSRFHGFRRVDAALVSRLVDPDWLDRGALVGLLGGRIVAVAEYARLRELARAEVAFTVADELHGLGIGTRLLEQLAARAARHGVEEFVAEVLPDNADMLHVFADAGFAVTRTLDNGEVHVEFAIEPSPAFVDSVERRDHIAVSASLRPFFAPRSVAVVGASPRRGSIGGELFRNILDADFSGTVYPVNPAGASVAGVRGYRSVQELPEAVDLVVVCVPGGRVLDAARDALASGVRALCVISAGFAEIGAAGVARQEQLLAVVRAHGARLVGPNCLGIAVPSLGLNATFAPRPLPAGNIGFSSQSGALGLALLEKAVERNLGFSNFVSIGNKADVSSNDLLEWWEDDEATTTVLLYLESFGNPRKFAHVAARVARRKPIIALKAGVTQAGARAASSHTAALAGSDAAADALFERAGVLRARDLEELLDVAALLSSQPLPAGRRVAILTNAGGLGILCTDACETAGLQLAALTPETTQALESVLPAEASHANPIDLLGSATAATYRRALPIVLDDPGVDSLIVLFVPPVVAGATEVADAIDDAVRRSSTAKPVLAVVLSADGTPEILRSAGSRVATFPYPESAARALGFAVRRSEWLSRPVPTSAAADDAQHDRSTARALVQASADGWLDPERTRRLLTCYGIPVAEQRLVTTAAAAVAAARELGLPVAVKSAAAGAHKTETGGVALDLETEAAVREAADRIGTPLLVQRMARGHVELLAGVVQDAVFGPLVAFAPGGVYAELIDDASFAIAPLVGTDADELVAGGKAGRLVAGYRGAPAVDAFALAAVLRSLSALALDNPEVAELDLNPLIASADGCVAVDARISVRHARPLPRVKTW